MRFKHNLGDLISFNFFNYGIMHGIVSKVEPDGVYTDYGGYEVYIIDSHKIWNKPRAFNAFIVLEDVID